MMLKALEFHVREQVWVFVVQIDNIADVNLVIVQVIDKRTTRVFPTQRPTHCVGHFAFVVVFWFYFPDLFHPNAKLWHVTVCI